MHSLTIFNRYSHLELGGAAHDHRTEDFPVGWKIHGDTRSQKLSKRDRQPMRDTQVKRILKIQNDLM